MIFKPCMTPKNMEHPMHWENDRVVGQLPSVFGAFSPEEMQDPEKQAVQRKVLLEQSVELCFGGIPPKPEVFHVTHLYAGTYRITAGTKEKTVSFSLTLFRPKGDGKHPVLLTGDQCAWYCNDEIMKLFRDKGYIVAQFNRAELAIDNLNEFQDNSEGVYPVSPDMRFGMIAAWAWGYHRAVDALLTMEDVDPDCICITGHSRGGKATLLAAATDERIAFTQASGSGCFGAGCFRYSQYEDDQRDIPNHHCEKLENMVGVDVPWNILHWIGPEMKEYVGREQELPFDMHFLKAAIAPRFFLETGGVDDVWANPRGSYQTFRAAREMYTAMGIPERIASVYREGGHGHLREDFESFLKFIEAGRAGKPFYRSNADSIFGELPIIYDWGM